MEDTQNPVLNVERLKSLETWLKTANIKLTQVNGQRKYGGPPEVWTGPVPGARCEVFISHIPRDAYEDLLIPLFASIGPLWEFRLMMNFSGQNRGFAYAKYGSASVAGDAVRLLHGHALEPGTHLSVRRSTEKRHLSIGELPLNTKPEQLLQVLRQLTDGVERVSLKTGPGIQGVSAVVVFSSHHAASMAKRVLVEAFQKQFSLAVSIKWFSAEKTKTPKAALLPPPQTSPPRGQYPVPPSTPSPGSFCRAVGGPAVTSPPVQHPSPSSPGPRHLAASPVLILQRLCVKSGVGQPLYEIHYSHTGPDGFLFFSYRVHVPGIHGAFSGLLMILPGPSASSTMEEAQRAAAQDVLQRVYSYQFSP